MKKLITICLLATMGAFEAQAQATYENEVINTIMARRSVRFIKTEPEAKFFLDSLEIPEDYQLNYIIAIGYPDEQPEAKPRNEGKVKYIK